MTSYMTKTCAYQKLFSLLKIHQQTFIVHRCSRTTYVLLLTICACCAERLLVCCFFFAIPQRVNRCPIPILRPSISYKFCSTYYSTLSDEYIAHIIINYICRAYPWDIFSDFNFLVVLSYWPFDGVWQSEADIVCPTKIKSCCVFFCVWLLRVSIFCIAVRLFPASC